MKYAVGGVCGKSRGDGEGSGSYATDDALAVLNYVAGSAQETLTKEVADCDKDGTITTDDALAILSYVAGAGTLS